MSNKARKKRMLRGQKSATSRICLRQPLGGGVTVDREAGVIRNVSIITEGEALGHGFSIDRVMLNQVLDGLSGNGRMRVRLTHPEGEQFGIGRDPIECLVGSVTASRLDGDRIRGDVQIAKFAEHSPLGNMREYLLSVAEEAPEAIGMSIVFEPDEFEQSRNTDGTHLAYGRVKKLCAVDFVGDPGANSNGLLSNGERSPRIGVKAMDEQMLADLKLILGLPEDATEEDVAAVIRARAIEGGGESSDEEPPAEESPPAEAAPPPEGMSAAPDPKAIALAERKRQGQIRQLAKSLHLPESWAQVQIDSDATMSQAKASAINEVQTIMAQANVRGASIAVGEDRNQGTLKDGIVDAILVRCNRIKPDKAHPRHREFLRPLPEIARRWLSCVGATDADMLTNTQVVERLGPRARRRHYPIMLAQSTSDFDELLADAMGKSLRMAYVDTPVKWQMFCSEHTAPDFKPQKPIAMSEAPNLIARDEGMGVEYVTLTDSQETATLVEYVNGIKLTRQAIINDDLQAFGRIPMLQGMAAKRKEDALAFGILTANAVLADNVALFDASTHINYLASGSGAPSVATLAALEALMLKQTGPKAAAYLMIEPAVLIVPTTLKVTAEQLVGSAVDPALANQTPNPYANKLQVCWHPLLTAASTTAWYLSADPNLFDTIFMYFLEGEREPVLRQETDFDTEDVKFVVRHTAIAKAIDYRGLAKSIGTA